MLVTGHTGLVGTWLCRWLVESGAEPVGFARRATDRASGVRGIVGDIRSRADVAAAVTSSAASVVVHLAAVAAARQEPELRHVTYETNVMGTVNVRARRKAWRRVRQVGGDRGGQHDRDALAVGQRAPRPASLGPTPSARARLRHRAMRG